MAFADKGKHAAMGVGAVQLNARVEAVFESVFRFPGALGGVTVSAPLRIVK